MTPENVKVCLKTIIGLSRRDCPCDAAGKPVDANVSLSGYYLTDAADGIPMNFVGGAVDCGTGGTWELLAEAREAGTLEFIRDLSLLIGEKHTKTFQDFNGRVGELNDTTWVTTARKNAVVHIRGFKGLPAKIKMIAASLKATCAAPVTIEIFGDTSLSGTPLGSVTVNTVAQGWGKQAFSPAVELDLRSDYERYTDYYLTWEIPAGCFMANTTTGCYSCSGGRQKGWQPFIEVKGYTVNDRTDFAAMTPLNSTYHGELTLGLSLDVFIGCNFGEWLCSLDYSVIDNGFSMTVAKMVHFAAVMKLATVLVNSTRVNAITQLTKENIYGKRSHAEKEYGNGVRWLAENLPDEAMRCYTCKDKQMATRQMII